MLREVSVIEAHALPMVQCKGELHPSALSSIPCENGMNSGVKPMYLLLGM